MLGVEILTWGTEGEESSYYYPVYHYLWGGSVGHAAIKLTMPCEPGYDAWIRQYCFDEKGEKLIPHYRLPRQNHWVVYFSWWPDELQEEYEDRIAANSGLCVEYEKKWQAHFNETIPQKTGMLRYKLGMIYDWFFGKPKQVPKPIHQIVHPHPQAQIISEQIAKKEADLRATNERLLPLLEEFVHLQNQLELLSFKHRYLELFADDNTQVKQLPLYLDMVRSCEEIIQKTQSIEKIFQPLLEAREREGVELNDLRRYFYDEIATVGCEPQRVHLPFEQGLSIENMLKSMHGIASKREPFDKIFYNCSTVVRQIMASGLGEEVKNSDCGPHLFDTPFKIRRFACDLQQKLINLRLQKIFVPQYRAKASLPSEAPDYGGLREKANTLRPSYS